MSSRYPDRGHPPRDHPSPVGAPGPRRRGPEGELHVIGSDEQADVPLDLETWVVLAREALTTEGVEGEAELSLLFVDQETMAELNLQFMAKTGPTDVLAFPIDEVGPTGRRPDAGTAGPNRHDAVDDLPLLLGDVVVCPAVAAAQAVKANHSTADELALLVVHGVLHVLGHDHAEPDETARMKARENALLDRLYRKR